MTLAMGDPCFDRTEDADFIAHARADVPALVAEVRRLRALAKDIIKLAEMRALWTSEARALREKIGGE
jgi:hypothetical protein